MFLAETVVAKRVHKQATALPEIINVLLQVAVVPFMISSDLASLAFS